MIFVIALFFSVIMCGCSTIPQKLDPKKFYRRDLPFCVENLGCFEGVTVLAKRDSYKFEVEPKGGADIDLMVATTCHREDSTESTESGWFIFQSNNKYEYTYRPVAGKEDTGDCPLRINTYEKDKGRHAWAMIYFEHPKFKMPATVTCMGRVYNYNGVSVCQSKRFLSQRIRFPWPVQWGTPAKHCAEPERVSSGVYDIKPDIGECVYVIRSEKNLKHLFATISYEGILIRSQ